MTIDLRSDTKTLPTSDMLAAMANARVGDDQEHEDFETNSLQGEVAELLGAETAIFVPSATMANLIALLCQVGPGEELVADDVSHILRYEGGGAAALAGATTRGLITDAGVLTPEQIREVVVIDTSEHIQRTALIAIENTHNTSGGTPWPLDALDALMSYADETRIPVHVDGSRLFNAATYHAVPPERLVRGASSITLCFSKGLGCPAGAVLAGTQQALRRAPLYRQMLGGSLRQAGVLAAAARHALGHHIDRLAEDHANAELLAQRLLGAGVPVVDHPRRTNFVLVDVGQLGLDSGRARAALEKSGVLWSNGRTPSLIRAVTHLGLSGQDVTDAADHTISALRAYLTN